MKANPVSLNVPSTGSGLRLSLSRSRLRNRSPFVLTMAGILFLLFQCGDTFAAQEILRTSRVKVGEKVPLTASLKKVTEEGKAIVLVLLSNPMQCNNCDKLINLLEEEAERYKNDATYIMAGGQDTIGAVDEETLGLKRLYGFVTVGEPWTFIIDKEGVLRKIFIGLFTREELKGALNGITGRMN